jgi:hypothetical protein
MEKAIPELISGYFFLNVAILQQWRCHKVGGKLENRPKGSSQNNRVTSLPSSCPALSRVSTRSMPSAGPVDGRIKSGHDDGREDGGSFILFRPLSSRLENLTARSPLPGNFPPARRGSGLALFHADGYCSLMSDFKVPDRVFRPPAWPVSMFQCSRRARLEARPS